MIKSKFTKLVSHNNLEMSLISKDGILYLLSVSSLNYTLQIKDICGTAKHYGSNGAFLEVFGIQQASPSSSAS